MIRQLVCGDRERLLIYKVARALLFQFEFHFSAPLLNIPDTGRPTTSVKCFCFYTRPNAISRHGQGQFDSYPLRYQRYQTGQYCKFFIILHPCSQLFHPDDERFSFFFSCDKSILTRLCSIKYDIRLRVKYLRTYACIQLVMKVFDRII